MTIALAATTAPHLARASASAPGRWADGVVWVQTAGIDTAALYRRPVLVEFWTFGCINCRRTIPAMRRLHGLLGRDLAIVAMHTPEFDAERDLAAVREAIARERIGYAVAQDNARRAWRAFGNRYWPALHLLDASGRVRHVHVGELHEGTRGWNDLLRAVAEVRKQERP